MASERRQRGGHADPGIRQRFIEALTYPRMLMTEQIDVDACPMHGYFNETLDACLVCDKGMECLWLSDHDEFSILARKPIEDLFEAFAFTIDYVDAYVTRDNHNPRRCACETCHWLREARRLVREYGSRVPRTSRR